jgi:hypothetical protein
MRRLMRVVFERSRSRDGIVLWWITWSWVWKLPIRKAKNMKKIFGLFSVLIALAFATNASAAPFTPGDIVIYRVGAGTNVLANSGNPVFLDEYDLSGDLIQSIPISTNSFCAQGTASTEGLLTLSQDGRYLILTGYDTNTVATSVTLSTGTTAGAVPRVIARVDASGSVDTSTILTNFASGGSPRGGASTDGTSLWGSGGAGGIQAVTFGATSVTPLDPDLTNVRGVNIYSNQVYGSAQSGAFRIFTSGPGLPTTTGQSSTNLTGIPTGTNSPLAFVFFKMIAGGANPVDTLYFADSGGNNATNGIYKFCLIGGTWVPEGVVINDTTHGPAIGLAGQLEISGTTTNVHLFTTSALPVGTAGSGVLLGYIDVAGFGQPMTGNGDTLIDQFDGNLIVSAPIGGGGAQEAFRGVALVPRALGAANLNVSTPGTFNSIGFKGGPFTPGNQVYTLSNTGTNSLTWTANKTAVWLTLSAASGSLASGQSVNITVTINANANSLTAGFYSDTLGFTNTFNGSGNTTRAVTLGVAQLGVTPSSGLAVTGPVSGPFTPNSQIYTLTNGSAASLAWGASILSSNWLTLSATSGSIPAGQSTNITVSVTNAHAVALSRGSYDDTVVFTNATTSDPGNATRSVSLQVGGGFSSNNIVIYRAGDGVLVLNNQPTPVFLDEYTRSGVLVQSVPVSTNNYACAGNATAEGLMTRSTDKQYLVFVGYGTNRTFGAPAPSSSSTNVPRVIGRVDGNGNVDVSTRLVDFNSGGNPRAAVSTNGIDMWVAGSVSGIRHTTLGSTNSSVVCTNPTSNFRALNIYSNQLYAGSASVAVRVTTVGTGLPTSDSVAVNLPGYSTTETSPYNFVLFKLKVGGTDPFDTLYVADDNANNAGSGAGGGAVFKWSLVGGTWTSNGFGNVTAARGLAGDVSIVGTTTNVNLFIVGSGNTTSGSGTLTAYTDSTGWNAAPSGNGGNIGTQIAVAPLNESWRSLALATEIPATANLSLTPGDFIVVDSPSSVTTNSKNYLVSNTSNSSMTWTATWSSVWLSLSSDGGTLAAGANTNITVSINGNATTLANGTYPDTVVYVNKTNGQGDTTRGVSLTITGGVSDAFSTWQNQYFGPSNPQAAPGADPFGKGMSNTNQFLTGFDPTNKSAYVHITALSRTNTTDARVDYLGASGNSVASSPIASRTNVLEFTAGTVNGSYSTNNFASTGVTNILSGGNGSGTLTNMVDPGGATNKPSRYYRVRVLVP